MKLLLATSGLWIAMFAPVVGQEQKGDCFQIISPIAGNPQTNFILLDRCKGATWMLVRTSHPESKTGQPDFTYKWMPLSVGDREPQFTRPTP
jgi:hypothetical protein